MKRRLPRATVAVAALVSIGAGLAAGLLPDHAHDLPTRGRDATMLDAARDSSPGDRVRAAAAGVERTGLYVGPELRDQLTDAEVASLERQIQRSPTPLFVVWWEDTGDGGYRSDSDALDQLRAVVDRDGYYAVLPEGGRPVVDALGYNGPYIDADGLGRPAAALQRLVDDMAAFPAEPRTDQDDLGPGDHDFYGGVIGGTAAGLLMAGVGYLLLLIVVGIAGVQYRSRTSGGRR